MAAWENLNVVIAAGAFPPPTTGQAKNMALIVEDLERNPAICVIRSNLAAGGLEKNLAYRFRKSARVVMTFVRLFAHARSPQKTLYLVADGGKGILYTDAISAIGDLLGYRLILQHRTFQHVENYSRSMARIDRRIRSGAHIFLCDCMVSSFHRQYKSQSSTLVVGNLSQYLEYSNSVLTRSVAPPNGPLAVGLLSNLFLEKGLDTFLAVADQISQSSNEAKFHLAGPAPDSTTTAMISEAKARLGERLEVWGPVSGTRKDAFYDAIDVFMFPTRYPLEAQPNVVLEAQCAGCFVIAPDRGCILEDLEQGQGQSIGRTEEVSVEAYVRALDAPLSNVDALRSRRRTSQEEAATRVKETRVAYIEFLQTVAYPDTTDERKRR